MKISTNFEPQHKQFLTLLQTRFEQNMSRHSDIAWEDVRVRLMTREDKLRSLQAMEQTGGEPDVVAYDKAADTYVFYDCSAETPTERRSLCYDRAAWESRKKNKPACSALEQAAELGIEILTEEQYCVLQELGAFDTKTSSWVATPDEIRVLGGALFCDRRYNRVFTYHNGAESYYSARGFRGSLCV